MEWLEIRDTDVSILDVLEAISEGSGTDGVLARFPRLEAGDVAHSAAMALRIIVRHWAQCWKPEAIVAEDRRVKAEFRKPTGWTEDEKVELLKLLGNGATVEQMGRIFLRMRAEISACLKEREGS